MSAQPDGPGRPGRVRPIPRTIEAIGEALTAEKRARFYGEVRTAEQGPELDGVLERWWMDAVLDQVPGRRRRHADGVAGRNLVPLPKPRGAAER